MSHRPSLIKPAFVLLFAAYFLALGPVALACEGMATSQTCMGQFCESESIEVACFSKHDQNFSKCLDPVSPDCTSHAISDLSPPKKPAISPVGFHPQFVWKFLSMQSSLLAQAVLFLI